MTLDVALVFIMGFIMMFAIYMRYRTNTTIWNLFAIGMIISLGYQFIEYVPILIVFVTMTVWLVYDTFWGYGE